MNVNGQYLLDTIIEIIYDKFTSIKGKSLYPDEGKSREWFEFLRDIYLYSVLVYLKTNYPFSLKLQKILTIRANKFCPRIEGMKINSMSKNIACLTRPSHSEKPKVIFLFCFILHGKMNGYQVLSLIIIWINLKQVSLVRIYCTIRKN